MRHFEEWKVIVTFNVALPVEYDQGSMAEFLHEGIKKGLNDLYEHKHERMGVYSNPAVTIQEIKEESC
jgi:hypothetical protein